MRSMPQHPLRSFPKKSITIPLVVLVVIVIGAVILYLRDHKTVPVSMLPATAQTTDNADLSAGPVAPPAADKLVQSFYNAFITSNQPTSIIKMYGTANLLAAYNNYYVHNSPSVSSQNYANGSIVCGSVKPKSITGVGTLTKGAASDQVQVVEVENKGSLKVSPTDTLSAEVIHQGNSLKINSIQCQGLVGSDNHRAS